MDCRKIQNLIPEYVDGELDQTLKDQVRLHMDTCPACQGVFVTHQNVWNLLQRQEVIEPSPHHIADFWTRVGRVKSQPERIMDFIFTPRFAVGLAGVCMAIVLIVLAGQWMPGEHGSGMQLVQNTESAVDILDILESDEPADEELLENLEFLENWEILEAMDALDDEDALLRGNRPRTV